MGIEGYLDKHNEDSESREEVVVDESGFEDPLLIMKLLDATPAEIEEMARETGRSVEELDAMALQAREKLGR